MKYYIVPQKLDQVCVVNSKGECDCLIAGELLQLRDCVKMGVPQWLMRQMQQVSLPVSETYMFFGARFPVNEEVAK